MGLLRTILLIILAVLLYRLVRHWLNQRTAAQRTRVQDKGRMLACAHCGTYFPEQDAVRDGDKAYCCTAHRDAQRKT